MLTNHKRTINVIVLGYECEVSYIYTKGWHGSLEEPPEEPQVEIQEIILTDQANEDFIEYTPTQLLESMAFNEAVEYEVWNQIYEY